MGGGIGAVGYIIVGGAGCMVGWHAGVPWSIFFSNISNLAAIPVTKFRNSKKSLDEGLLVLPLFCFTTF